MFKKILVAVDGSDHAKAAVTVAARAAQAFGAELVIFHAMRRLGSDRVPESLMQLEHVEHVRVSEADMLRSVAQSVIDEARDIAESAGVSKPNSATASGDPAGEIIDYCKANGVDLVVIGRRGLGKLSGLLLGSVSQKVSQFAPCACMTVPSG